jgi:hypothetical protein
MRNVSDKIRRESQNTHFIFNNFFFESRVVYEIRWEKYCKVGQATDNKMAHVHCMLETQGYRHALFFRCNNGFANAP